MNNNVKILFSPAKCFDCGNDLPVGEPAIVFGDITICMKCNDEIESGWAYHQEMMLKEYEDQNKRERLRNAD